MESERVRVWGFGGLYSCQMGISSWVFDWRSDGARTPVVGRKKPAGPLYLGAAWRCVGYMNYTLHIKQVIQHKYLFYGLKLGRFLFYQDEDPVKLLEEPCAINSFDIDPQNPSDDSLLAYQVAFDLVENENQASLMAVKKLLNPDPTTLNPAPANPVPEPVPSEDTQMGDETEPLLAAPAQLQNQNFVW